MGLQASCRQTVVRMGLQAYCSDGPAGRLLFAGLHIQGEEACSHRRLLISRGREPVSDLREVALSKIQKVDWPRLQELVLDKRSDSKDYYEGKARCGLGPI